MSNKGWGPISDDRPMPMCKMNQVDIEAFHNFTGHFGMTKMYWRIVDKFQNIRQFMAGTRYYNNGNDEAEFPGNGTFDHLAAYMDDEWHVLVVSHPYGWREEEILDFIHKWGLAAVICGCDKKFYKYTNSDIFMVMSKETFTFFDSRGLLDGWKIKTLQ